MGTYLVTGNHEYYFGNAIEWLDYFKSIKINVLDNRFLIYLNKIDSQNLYKIRLIIDIAI